MKSKGLRVNFKKTNMLVNSENAGKVTMKGKFPCAVSLIPSYASFTGVGFIRDV